MATGDNSGLWPETPKAPGNAKSGMPPKRSEAGGEKPHWLDPSQAKWTKSRVSQIDERLTSKAGRFNVTEGQPKPAPGGFQVL
jgi:hypothetical protein